VHWGWVAIGVALGGVLIGTVVPIVQAIPPRPDVAVLIGTLTFGLTGVLVGFFSPGRTIFEATLTGLILAFVVPVIAHYGWNIVMDPRTTFLGIPAAIVVATAGGWIGEIMQGTIAEDKDAGFQWSWVTVGTALGVLTSVYAVFIPNALIGTSAFATLLLFLGSFFFTGFVVAFLSPGATLLEPAAAAGLAILADAFLALMGLHVPFPLLAIVIAIVMAFLIALAGGYVGEVAHNLYYRTAWGGTFRGVEVPKPGQEG
jgi:hypothetical protein